MWPFTLIQPTSKWMHWATLRRHSDLFRAATSASSQVILILSKSLLTVLLQSVHGRPGPLLNPGTSQCNACRVMRWWSIRITYSSHRSLLSLSMSSILCCPVLTLTSSFVTLSFQEMPKMLLCKWSSSWISHPVVNIVNFSCGMSPVSSETRNKAKMSGCKIRDKCSSSSRVNWAHWSNINDKFWRGWHRSKNLRLRVSIDVYYFFGHLAYISHICTFIEMQALSQTFVTRFRFPSPPLFFLPSSPSFSLPLPSFLSLPFSLTFPALPSRVIHLGSGERYKLSHWGPGQSPGRKRIFVYFELEHRIWWWHFSLFLWKANDEVLSFGRCKLYAKAVDRLDGCMAIFTLLMLIMQNAPSLQEIRKSIL